MFNLKKKATLLLAVMFAASFFTACNIQNLITSNTDSASSKEQTTIAEEELKPIVNITETFSSDFEKCKVKEYENLDFSQAQMNLSLIDSCCNLTITTPPPQKLDDEVLKKFKDYVTFFLGEYNSDNGLFKADFKYEMYLYDELIDGKYSKWPIIDEHYEDVQKNDVLVNALLYRDIENSTYLSWHLYTQFPHWVTKGEAFSYIKTEDLRHSSWLPSDMDSKVASYLNNGTNDDVTYKLIDGDVSVGDAIDYFENEYLDSLPFEYQENSSFRVVSLDVYSITEDFYGYVLNFSQAWKGMAFDRRGEFFSNAAIGDTYLSSGEALMIRDNDVDTYINFNLANITESDEPIENMIGLAKAVDIMSEELTEEVEFEVQTIELIYSGKYSADRQTATLSPSWKIITYNSNDLKYYDVYVDATTGYCTYVSYTPL